MSKVILLAPTPPPAGGIATWAVRMMNAGLKNGWQAELVDESVIGNRQIFGEGSRRNVFTEARRCFRIWGDLKRALRDPDARVVHSCIPSLTLSMLREYVCARITKRRGRKFIVHLHSTVPNAAKGRFAVWLLKKLCDASDMVITLNTRSIDCVMALTQTPCRLIPNFVMPDEVVDCHDIRPDIRTAVYVGGVVEEKGAYDILKVAKLTPDVIFRLVGNADAEVKKAAEGLRNVVFVGAIPHADVKRELMNADVFIFMSHFRGEGFSVSLTEAMAAGLPCIVTDWAANRNMIGDEGGAVVAVGDAEGAAEAFARLRDPELRKKCSEANIKKVSEKYTSTAVIDQFVGAYADVIGDKTQQ